MVWMRSDVDLSTPPDQGFRHSKTRFWPWALGGVVAMLVLALVEAPVWVFALAMMAWCVAGAVLLQRDVIFALRQITDASVNSKPTRSDEPNWQNWVSGWYWETDARHHLKVFKPGVGLPRAISVDWSRLSDYVELNPLWLSNWSAEPACHEADLGRLAYCLAQKVACGDALDLPWPEGLQGVSVEAPGWRCAVQAEPRWDEQGQFLGFRGVMQMVPPVADRASEAATALSRAEAEDAAQNAQMREAEQEVLRYALSHDLRAPLRVVEGFTRIVKEDYGRAMDRLGNDHLDRVLTAAARMNGMIDAILAQAQLAAEPLQRVGIDLSAMAREIGAEQSAMVNEGCASAEVVVAQGMHEDADPLLVRRVLENLISNALKYSAKVAQPRVEVGVMPATNPAVFFVRDNGAGFDMQHADKLFGMFQRLHSAKEFPGTGVGLAGVQNIVRRHGGRIWAEARPGEGACFYFTLMGTVEAQQRAQRSE